jgi:succinate-acetate transporter protein
MKSYTKQARKNLFRWILATFVCFILFITNNVIIWRILHVGGAIGILVGIMAVGYWQNEHEISKRTDFILKKKRQAEKEFEIISNTAQAET